MSYVVYKCNRNQDTGLVEGRTTDLSSKVPQGFSFLDKLDESLDIGNIILTRVTDSEPYDMFDWIEIYDDTELILSQRIAGDSVKLVGKNPLKYEHSLSLVEHTKILERFLISGKTFTQPTDGTTRYYLYDVLDRLIDTTPLETDTLISSTRVCVLPTSGDLYDYLTSVESPEFTLKDITLREAFKQVGDVFDGIPRLFINDSDELELTFDLVGNLKNLISNESDFTDISRQQDITLYATQIESESLNVVSDTSNAEAVEIFPSDNAFITLRKDTFLQDGYDDNAYVPTPKRIYDVLELICRAKISVINTVTTDTYYNGYTNIRINERLVEKKLYDTLEFDGADASTKYKTTTIYYEYLSKKVQIGITYGLWGISQVILNVLEVSIYNQGIEDGVIPAGTDISEISFALVSPTTVDDLLYQVHYIPIPQSMRINIDREDINDVKYTGALQSNQQSRIVNLQNFSNNLKGRINKIGNYDMQLEHRVTTFSELYNVRDYTDELYIVTKREVICFNDVYYAKYELTKNFNKVNDFLAVNSEIRQWEIGENNTLDRNLIYQEYCEIDAVTSGNGKNVTKLLTDDGASVFMNTLNKLSTQPPVRGGIASGTDFDDPVFISMSSNGGGNTLMFNGKFPDNKSAGFTRETVSGQIAKNFISYTDEDALSQDLEIYMFDSVDTPTLESERLTNADNYPKTTLTAPNIRYISSDSLNELIMYKDSREIIGLTYLLKMISKDNDKLIIGKKFSNRNRLVSENPPSTLRIYASDTYKIDRSNNDKVDTTKWFVLGLPAITIDSANFNASIVMSGLDSSKASWILADDDKNILLGVNQDGELLDTITFDFVNKRSGINYKY